MGKHKVSSNVLQLNTVKKKKKGDTSASTFQKEWEQNRRGEEASFLEDMLTFTFSGIQDMNVDLLGCCKTHNML